MSEQYYYILLINYINFDDDALFYRIMSLCCHKVGNALLTQIIKK